MNYHLQNEGDNPYIVEVFGILKKGLYVKFLKHFLKFLLVNG